MTTIEQLYATYLRHPSVQTDTRLLRDGDIFFALKGPNFNGNNFAHRALEQGAAYAVIDEKPSAGDDRLLLVGDVLTALQDLALHHRKQFDIPFIAITGSNGKTTTKELIHAVLSAEYTTYTTKGNLNNHIGGPEGVKKGKGELYDHLRDVGGTAFVLKDSDDLRQMSRGIPHVITYGTKDADFIGRVAPSKNS